MIAQSQTPPISLAPMDHITPHSGDILPMWLTKREAETLLELCATSSLGTTNEAETALFGKLGDVLRAYMR